MDLAVARSLLIIFVLSGQTIPSYNSLEIFILMKEYFYQEQNWQEYDKT